MRSLKSGLFCLIILFVAQGVFAQRAPGTFGPPPTDPNNPPPDWMRRMEENRRAMDKFNGKDSNGMIAGRTIAPKPRRADGKAYTKEELEKIRLLSSPREADLVTHKDFLRQPNTGIFRLFPDIKCQSEFLVEIDGECENSFFAVKSYSFRKDARLIDDIKFLDEILIADGFFSQEMMVRLGDVDLNRVTPADKGLNFLADYAAPASMTEARSEYARFAGGVEKDGYRYANKLKAENGVTYGLRVIAYRVGNDVWMSLNKDIKRKIYSPEKGIFLIVKEDNRIDLTLAFRIIRRDEDGSVTILWKELKRQPAPKLTFAKGERYRTLKSQ